MVSHYWRHSKPKFCPFSYHFHNICINLLLKLCIMDATWIFILLQGCFPPWEQPTVLGLSLANRTLLLAIGNGKSGRLKQDSMIFLAQFCLGIPMSVENCCMEWGSYARNIPQCHCIYCQTSNTRHKIPKLKCFTSHLAVYFAQSIGSQVLSWEWRSSWSSADIWVLNNFIAY